MFRRNAMGLRFNAPSSSGATGAAHNSDCHVGRRLLLPVTKKCSTLQSAMSRLRKGEMHVQFLSQEFIRLFTAGYHVLLWLEGFFKAVCLWNGQPVLFEIKIAGKKDTTHSEILFLCIYQVRMCSWYAPSLFPKNTPNHGSQPPSSRSEQMCCCDP